MFAGGVQLRATPLPFQAIGLNQTIQVSSTLYPVSYSIGNGGGFSISVTPNGSNITYTTIGWCVDLNNDVGVPQTFQGNVTLLDDSWTNGQNPYVRKGTNSTWYFDNLTPLQRYQGAAYALSQFPSFPAGPSPDGPTAQQINNANWDFTADSDPYGILDSNPLNNPYYLAARSAILADPDFGKYRWAAISGVVDAFGNLTQIGSGTNQNVTTQTFLVQVDLGGVTPEPATWTLIALGGLLLVRRKKRA